MNKKAYLIQTLYRMGLMAVAALAISACNEDPVDGKDAGRDTGGNDGGNNATLTLSFTGLEDLGADYVYEGWLMVDGSPVTSGRFSVDDKGELSTSSFSIPAAHASATAFILTIEPATGDVPAPSDVHIVAGDISGGSANLTIDHGAALGTDFSTAAGAFILAAPTSAADDDQNGIWWLDPTGPASTLTLPTLPAGWTYEGWVVDVSGAVPVPVSTGTFTSPTGADSDGAGSTAGTDGDPAPGFPGQDFVNPARDLTDGHMAVISIEPVPDYSAAPFSVKPLGVMIGSDLVPTLQAMTNNGAADFPTGTATITAAQ